MADRETIMSALGLDITAVLPRLVLRWSQVKQAVVAWYCRVRSHSELVIDGAAAKRFSGCGWCDSIERNLIDDIADRRPHL